MSTDKHFPFFKSKSFTYLRRYELREYKTENDWPIEKAKKLLQESRGCTCGPKGSPCSRQFPEEVILYDLNICLELLSHELDLVILANIEAFTNTKTIGSKSKLPRSGFYNQSQPICKDMFLHFYGLSYSHLKRLKEHYQDHGISFRTCANRN